MPVFDRWAARLRQQRQRSFAQGFRHYLTRYALMFVVVLVLLAIVGRPSWPRLAAAFALFVVGVVSLSGLSAIVDRGTARVFDRLAGGPDNPSELSWAAGLRSSPLRTIVGRLRVADARIEFSPNAFDRVLHAKPWTRQLSDIADIAAERNRLPRTQLRLTVANGKDWWFVVNEPDAVAVALRRARDGDEA